MKTRSPGKLVRKASEKPEVNIKNGSKTFNLNNNKRLFLIAGPCVVESEKLTFNTARKLKEITEKLGIYIYRNRFSNIDISHSELQSPLSEFKYYISRSVERHN